MESLESKPDIAPFFRIAHAREEFKVPRTADRAFVARLFKIPPADLVALEIEGGYAIPLADGGGFDPQVFELLQGRRGTLRLAPTDWAKAKKMTLGGGSGGESGKRVYVPPVPGMQVVSSAPVWSDSNYHYMGYLFQGSSLSPDHTEYWLTKSDGPQTLSFSFTAPINLALIRVSAKAYESGLDRRSRYQIHVTTGLRGEREVTEGMVNTANDVFGTFRNHEVHEEGVTQIVFHLTRELNYGVCLKKIELWAVD
jgi:hypothetical protein